MDRKQGVRLQVLNALISLRPLRLLSAGQTYKMSLDLLSHFSKVGFVAIRFFDTLLSLLDPESIREAEFYEVILQKLHAKSFGVAFYEIILTRIRTNFHFFKIILDPLTWTVLPLLIIID